MLTTGDWEDAGISRPTGAALVDAIWSARDTCKQRPVHRENERTL